MLNTGESLERFNRTNEPPIYVRRVPRAISAQNTNQEEKCRIADIFDVSAQYYIPTCHGSHGVT